MNNPTQHTEQQQLQILNEWWDTLMRHLANLQELVIEDPPTANAIIRLTDIMYAQNVRGGGGQAIRVSQPAKVLSLVARQTPNERG